MSGLYLDLVCRYIPQEERFYKMPSELASINLRINQEESRMKKLLVTGGTAFVSRYIAEYYVKKGYEVFVLNRNTKEQSQGVHLIEADRNHPGELLRKFRFDVVIDNAYTSQEVETLLNALGNYGDYILISSSAVYPETAVQPFTEDTPVSVNKFWRQYGTDKIEAESALLSQNPNAYIIRPPYLYGPMNQIYREAFVFECALAGRKFYLPGDGELKLQFYYIHDLCRFIDALLQKKPSSHIFNVGNKEVISIRKWAELCYKAAGKEAEFVNVYENIEQWKYFSFYDYEYYLDTTLHDSLLPETTPLSEGLKSSFEWYKNNLEKIERKEFIEYIDRNII